MKTTAITEQELAFVHEYVSNGFSGHLAYRVAFEIKGDDDKSKQKCYSGAYNLLKKKHIQDAIDVEEGSYRAKAREMEMGRDDVLKELKNVIWGMKTIVTKDGEKIQVEEDGKTKIQAINTLVKLTGDFSPEQKVIDFTTEKQIDTKNLSDEDLKKLQTRLMDEL